MTTLDELNIVLAGLMDKYRQLNSRVCIPGSGDLCYMQQSSENIQAIDVATEIKLLQNQIDNFQASAQASPIREQNMAPRPQIPAGITITPTKTGLIIIGLLAIGGITLVLSRGRKRKR